jgi:hypothetical protein
MVAEDRGRGRLPWNIFLPGYRWYLRRLSMSTVRAARYRRLALREPDMEKARILLQLAEEAERGTLCTVDQLSGSKVAKTDSSYKAPENPETKWYYR